MTMHYNPPPNWPTPPAGWVPAPGWSPDPTWGPPPAGWKLWVDDRSFLARHKVLTAVSVIAVLFVAFIVVIAVAVGTAAKHVVDKAKTGTGALSHPEDFSIDSCTADTTTGDLAASVTITNHSSKASHYLGTLAWDTPDGRTQLDTSPITADALQPGQSVVVKGFSTTLAPTGTNAFVCKIIDSARISAVG